MLQPPDLLGSPSLSSLQLLHDLPSGGRKADLSALACIVLLAFLENGCNTCLLLLSCGWDFRDGGLRRRHSFYHTSFATCLLAKHDSP